MSVHPESFPPRPKKRFALKTICLPNRYLDPKILNKKISVLLYTVKSHHGKSAIYRWEKKKTSCCARHLTAWNDHSFDIHPRLQQVAEALGQVPAVDIHGIPWVFSEAVSTRGGSTWTKALTWKDEPLQAVLSWPGSVFFHGSSQWKIRPLRHGTVPLPVTSNYITHHYTSFHFILQSIPFHYVIYTHTYIYICIYTCMDMCIHIYIYIYSWMYYIYIYT